ncbi:MAG: peptidase inhibitor family I36 protein [Actinomycetota bacterium]|nr:peptidase inhibitor family I36 protein [Actinomycetota bacterium]
MKRTALIALISMVALAPAAGEAAKGKTKKSCPKEALCVWTKAGFAGKRVVVKDDGVSNAIANKINNKASSIKNRFGETIRIYDKRNANGELRCVGGVGQVDDLGGSYNFDNRAASSKVLNGPTPCF